MRAGFVFLPPRKDIALLTRFANAQQSHCQGGRAASNRYVKKLLFVRCRAAYGPAWGLGFVRHAPDLAAKRDIAGAVRSRAAGHSAWLFARQPCRRLWPDRSIRAHLSRNRSSRQARRTSARGPEISAGTRHRLLQCLHCGSPAARARYRISHRLSAAARPARTAPSIRADANRLNVRSQAN
jgi:hypothetical protein